jgi:hypothetical protein
VEQCLPEEQGGRCGGDQVRARAREDYRDEKASFGDAMIENEHVQTNSRKATREDFKIKA